MKLKDYINYRYERKGKKATNYLIRTQHFYDGKTIRIGETSYPGILANFMNSLAIPEKMKIANAQRESFFNMSKTVHQSNILYKIQQNVKSAAWTAVNTMLDGETLQLINELERYVDAIISLKPKKDKKTKQVTSLTAAQTNQLNLAVNSFINYFNQLKNHPRVDAMNSIVQNLDMHLQKLQSLGINQDTVFVKSSQFKTKKGKDTSFINLFSNAIMNLKGIPLFEHAAVKFIDKYIMSQMIDDIGFAGTGQITIDGNYASQDAVFFNKNIKIKTINGIEITLEDYFKNIKSGRESINIPLEEWDQVMRYAIGVQSKYSRYGHIKMTDMSLGEIINRCKTTEARALKMLYILKNQTHPTTEQKMITHKFNVKISGQAQSDYNRLFSYALHKHMSQIMHHNYYMVTKSFGVIDAYTYYDKLFSSGSYFHPIGDINFGSLTKDYRISIEDKF